MQLFAKFENILRRGFRATLNFRKFKVALNPLRSVKLYHVKETYDINTDLLTLVKIVLASSTKDH